MGFQLTDQPVTRFSIVKHVSGSATGTPKLAQLPVRTSQKVKATLANIPVGNYEGGGRGKEREREKEREKEREAAGSGHFSFDTQSSPATHPMDELPPERLPESSADVSEPRSREGTTTKEVRGPSDSVLRGRLCEEPHKNRLYRCFVQAGWKECLPSSPLLPPSTPAEPSLPPPHAEKEGPAPKKLKARPPPLKKTFDSVDK